MIKKLLIIFFWLNVAIVSAQQLPWRLHEKELNISFTNEDERFRFSQLGLNADIYSGFARVYATPEELTIIENAGFSYSVAIEDMNQWAMQYKGTLVPEGYYTFNQIKAIADSLSIAFPSICKKYIFGYTAGGQELAALKISDSVDFDQNEAEVMLDGGIHGDEVGASQNVIQFARDICLAYGTETDITNLINNREIWLYYCVNPWGRDNMTRWNSNLVDINRDFGYMWDGSGASSAPFSQNESRALRDCMNTNQFVSYTNYHSGYEVISYPWSYLYAAAPDNSHFQQLAMIYSTSSGYSNLYYGQGSNIMYRMGGSTKDFLYATSGTIAWSMEISTDKQPAGPNIQMLYQYNKPAMLAQIEYSGYGISGVVTDSITGAPVAALIFSGNNYPTYADPGVGDFHKFMKSGTYDLKITASGYKTKYINAVQVNDEATIQVNVQLVPEEGDYAYKVVAVRVPYMDGSGPSENYYTAACLGKPDQMNYSLGKGGYLRIDMGRPVIDGEGNDLRIIEGDDSPEGCTVLAAETIDGPWIPMGAVVGTTDLDLATTTFPSARYFMLQDDNDGQYTDPFAGYDLDAIRILSVQEVNNAVVSGTVTDKKTHEPIADVKIQLGDSVVYTGVSGLYSFEMPAGEYIITATHTDYVPFTETLNLAEGESEIFDIILQEIDTDAAYIPLKDLIAEVYPNPFSDRLTITITTLAQKDVQMLLYDASGKVIFDSGIISCFTGKNSISFLTETDMNKLSRNAVYLLRIESEGRSAYCKIMRTL
jgi:hypothetical protein